MSNDRFSRFVWDKARYLNKIPGLYYVFSLLKKMILRDGNVSSIPLGPLKGLKWKYSREHQLWMALGTYEPKVSEFINAHLSLGDIFYDIGANSGYFTLLGAKIVGNKGKVLAFEPVPHNVEIIQTQVNLNNMSQSCIILPYAISFRHERLKFHISNMNANSHLELVSDNTSKKSSIRTIDVQATTLNQIVSEYPFPSFIKIDIEGAEILALRGASNILSANNKPMIMVSVHNASIEKETKDILRSYGYKTENMRSFEQMVIGYP